MELQQVLAIGFRINRFFDKNAAAVGYQLGLLGKKIAQYLRSRIKPVLAVVLEQLITYRQ